MGVSFMRSAWEATPIEALTQLCGGKVTLGVSGSEHPVVNLGVELPAMDTNPAMSVRFLHYANGAAYVRVEAMYPGDEAKAFFAEALTEGRTNAEAIAEAVNIIEATARERGIL